MNPTSIYDNPTFFQGYQQLRQNPISLNEIVEKPTMLRLLPALQGKRLLDLGCGMGGHLLRYMQAGAAQVAGLDLSHSMLAQAEQNLRQAGFSQFTLHCLPMEQLAQIGTRFEVITSSFTFHYIADLGALLRAIHAQLEPEGVLVFSQEHPITTCFRREQGKRWEKDKQNQQLAYRLAYYREEGERERNWFQQSFKTYHRTTATIINLLIENGFILEQIAEPMLADQPEWQYEFKDLRHRPPLLFIRVRKR